MVYMKLVAIYCIWDDWDLFERSLKNIRPLVDGVIVVWSRTSNFGEESIPPTVNGDFFYQMEPDLKKMPQENERAKRNFGLELAKEAQYTHFLMLDADEYYDPQAFLKEKERFKNDPNLNGLVCGLKCYFKEPNLRVEDKTLVPFIHKLTKDLHFTWNTRYPFAFTGVKREIRIDPTRQMNIESGVEWSDIVMHHASWIRKDYDKKIRNSTARANIEKSTILNDLLHAKPGYYCEFYGKTLEPCSDLVEIWAKAKANS